MPKIFGIELTTFVGRVAYAVVSGGILLFLYYEIPNVLYKGMGQLPSFGFEGFYYYAVLIAVLSALSIIFKEKALGDAAGVASAIAQLTYIFVVTNGGVMSFDVSSVGAIVSLDFRPILYLLMLPSALLIISTIIGAVSRSSLRRFENMEEVVLA
jgi:hypothetical protein